MSTSQKHPENKTLSIFKSEKSSNIALIQTVHSKLPVYSVHNLISAIFFKCYFIDVYIKTLEVNTSTLICYQHKCNQPHLLSTSLAFNSLAICFTCSRPHLHSGLTCYHASLAIRPHLLSGLTCYQASLALQTHFQKVGSFT